MISVTRAKYKSNYSIEVVFNDGQKGVINFLNILKNDHRKIFNELLDKNKFKKFKVAFNTIIWENGLDLAPEFLKNLIKK